MAVNDHSYVIIGGSTKCASSALFIYLAEHPSISRSLIKEHRFFWTGDYELLKKGDNYFDGMEKYDHVFDDKPNAKYRLEATPDYLYSENSAKLIKESLADVKMVFIIREPLGRLISWYKYSKQLKKITSETTISEYINVQLQSNEISPFQHYRAVEQGRYGHYLQKYIELFGAESVMIIDYERLSLNPKEVMFELSGFLKIDSSFYKKYDFKIVNQSFNVKNVDSFNKYRALKKMLRRTFKKALPAFLKKPISNTFKKIDNVYMKSSSNDWGDLKISDEIIGKLEAYYSSDKQLLDNLKKLSLPIQSVNA